MDDQPDRAQDSQGNDRHSREHPPAVQPCSVITEHDVEYLHAKVCIPAHKGVTAIVPVCEGRSADPMAVVTDTLGEYRSLSRGFMDWFVAPDAQWHEEDTIGA